MTSEIHVHAVIWWRILFPAKSTTFPDVIYNNTLAVIDMKLNFFTECLPPKPLHPAGPSEEDSPLHSPADPTTCCPLCAGLHPLPLSQNVLPCSHLFTYTSQVRQFTAGNVHIFADELFLYNVLVFFIKVQGHRFVTYFHAGKIKVLGHIFCLSKISCNRGHISVKYFKF